MAQALNVSDDRLPAYLRLRDDIARRIAAGEWKPDEALPSDNRLAAEHALSVGTVRKALQKLSDEGLLERRQGAGTFLRKPAFDATLFRFFQVREHGSEQSIPTSRLISRALVTPTEHVAAALGTTEVIRIERLRCLSEQPLLFEEIYIPQSRFPGFATIPADEIGPLLYPVYFERFGVFVARAEDEVSFGTADHAVAQRLGLGEGAAVATIERTAFAMTGEAVEWRVAYGRADRFRYRSRIG
ncbi:HTH-type transcriptional repressor YvoA [Roseovarius sp. THAF27]|uniref:GntR family transcriptional regulator n=1 Tax=Roseovarius sp. THAF27 TaxID=2587850 RepID=UPI0012692025|nr:GntR family transcriptional regulator [Roseovarius sp. THAF27]QFT79995.1 HTH-type transcriptional repressor YvoA [Roseovarius sp. THAF27]